MSRYIFHNDLEMMFISTHATTATLTHVFPRRTERNKNLLDNMSEPGPPYDDPHFFTRLNAKFIAKDTGEHAGMGRDGGPVLEVTWEKEELNQTETPWVPNNWLYYQLGPNTSASGHVFYARFTTLRKWVLPPPEWAARIRNLEQVLAGSYKPEDVPWVENSEEASAASYQGPPPPPLTSQSLSTVTNDNRPASDFSDNGSDVGSVASNGSAGYA
jgi:hypothetical protein